MDNQFPEAEGIGSSGPRKRALRGPPGGFEAKHILLVFKVGAQFIAPKVNLTASPS